jgi:7-cyano-7-deazaguanine reductase
LKLYKMYLLEYRNLGIFQENVVNRVLADVVKAAQPVRAEVIGDWAPRGGLSTLVTAGWSRAGSSDVPRDVPRAGSESRARRAPRGKR